MADDMSNLRQNLEYFLKEVEQPMKDLSDAERRVREIMSRYTQGIDGEQTSITGDFGEVCAALFFGGTLLPRSVKSKDIEWTKGGISMQVKATRSNGKGETSRIKNPSADFYALVRLSDTGLEFIRLLTRADVESVTSEQKKKVLSINANSLDDFTVYPSPKQRGLENLQELIRKTATEDSRDRK